MDLQHHFTNQDKKSLFKTPENVKNFFTGLIHPCLQDKSPAVQAGESWKNWIGDENNIILAGLNLEKAKLVVVDVDLYKKEFSEDKNAQAFYEKVKQTSRFMQKTQSNGEHYFFKKPEDRIIKNAFPFSGVEIKSAGGYVCLYNFPFLTEAGFDSFQEFYEALPEFKFKYPKQQKTDNWREGNRNNMLNKEVYAGSMSGNPLRILKAAYDAGRTGLPWAETQATAQSGLNSGEGLSIAKVLKIIQPKKTKLKIENIANNAKNETAMLKTRFLTEKDIKKPVAFITNFLLDNDFNFVGGPTKLGKSRAILTILSKELNDKKQNGLILTTENDPYTMLAPLLKELKAMNRFKILDENSAKWFPKANLTGQEKAQIFVNRISEIINEKPREMPAYRSSA